MFAHVHMYMSTCVYREDIKRLQHAVQCVEVR